MIFVHRVGDLAEEAQEFGFLAEQAAGASVGASVEPASIAALGSPFRAASIDSHAAAAGIFDAPMIVARVFQIAPGAGPVDRDVGEKPATAPGAQSAPAARDEARGAQPNASPAMKAAPAVAAATGWDAASASQPEAISSPQVIIAGTAQTIYGQPPVGEILNNGKGATPAQVRAALGVTGLTQTGAGIKVGVISNGFNGKQLSSVDMGFGTVLPSQANVKVLQELLDANSDDEGRAMMQVVHEIAPGAQLDFCTASGSAADFANNTTNTDTAFAHAILALAADGCKVICDDYTLPDQPWFQSGVVAEAIKQIEAQGVVYLSCAGNQNSAAQQGYSGSTVTDPAYQTAWHGTPVTLYTPTAGFQTFNDALSFNGSPFLNLTLQANSSCQLQLEWDEAWGQAADNLALVVSVSSGSLTGAILQDGGSGKFFVYSRADNPLLNGESANLQNCPLINSGYSSTPGLAQLVNNFGTTVTYQISVINLGGADPGLVKFMARVNGGTPGGVVVQGANSGAVIGWHNSPYQITVGAADAGNTPALGAPVPLSEYFSASGVNEQYLFDAAGNRLATPQNLVPVAITGIDDINTSDIVNGQEFSGIPNFYGTSCATPSVAGVVALMLQANSQLNTFDVQNLLQDSAIPMAKSSVSGAGLVQANKAVAYSNGVITEDATKPVWLGTHLSETFSFANKALLTANSTYGLGGSDAARLAVGITANDADFTNLHNITILQLTGGDTVTIGAHAAAASVTVVSNINTGGNFNTVYDANGIVNMTNAQASVVGGGDKVNLVGSASVASLYNTGGVWDTATGSGVTVNLGNAQVSVVGGGDKINFIGSAASIVSLYSTNGNWDAVNGSHQQINLSGAQAAITGGGDTIYASGGSSVSLAGTNGTWDAVNGSSEQVILTGAQAAVAGGANTIYANQGSSVSLSGTKGNWDAVYGSGEQIILASAQAAITGGSNTIYANAGSSMSLFGTNGNWDAVNGSGDQIILSGAQAAITGGSNTIYANAGSSISLLGTKGNWDAVYGASETVILSSAQAAITGGGNAIFANAGSSMSLYNTGAAKDVVTGSNDSVVLVNAKASLKGNGDTVSFSGNNALTVVGASETFSLGQQLGFVSISGFAASDTIRLSTADWANYAALISSGDLHQSGADTVISINASNTITLFNVQATSLSQSQFMFA